MNQGKEMRMGRLFDRKSGRMVLVTIDHGICINPMKEIADPAKVVAQAVAGGADAVLLTPGIARLVYKELSGTDTSLMLRIDGTATSIGPDLTNDELICSVEGALAMGADAVATFGYLFLGAATPGCLDAADSDDNGSVELSDGVRTLSFLFLGGAPPAPPFPDCGEDLPGDVLGCAGYEACP